jgi:hypothetical protein
MGITLPLLVPVLLSLVSAVGLADTRVVAVVANVTGAGAGVVSMPTGVVVMGASVPMEVVLVELKASLATGARVVMAVTLRPAATVVVVVFIVVVVVVVIVVVVVVVVGVRVVAEVSRVVDIVGVDVILIVEEESVLVLALVVEDVAAEVVLALMMVMLDVVVLADVGVRALLLVDVDMEMKVNVDTVLLMPDVALDVDDELDTLVLVVRAVPDVGVDVDVGAMPLRDALLEEEATDVLVHVVVGIVVVAVSGHTGFALDHTREGASVLQIVKPKALIR